MTDISARHDTFTRHNKELNKTGAIQRDQKSKGLWQTIVARFWDLSEDTGKMDTRPFNGLL